MTRKERAQLGAAARAVLQRKDSGGAVAAHPGPAAAAPLRVADRIGHGTDQRGERCATAKLTADDVHAIRARLAAGEPQAAVARDYGLAQSTVGKIGRRERWGHL